MCAMQCKRRAFLQRLRSLWSFEKRRSPKPGDHKIVCTAMPSVFHLPLLRCISPPGEPSGLQVSWMNSEDSSQSPTGSMARSKCVSVWFLGSSPCWVHVSCKSWKLKGLFVEGPEFDGPLSMHNLGSTYQVLPGQYPPAAYLDFAEQE